MDVALALHLFSAVVGFAIWAFRPQDDPPRPSKQSRKTSRPKRPEPHPSSFQAQTSSPIQKTIKGRAFVVDGDTISIKKTQIRLFGIDAPELDHPYGTKAKWAMVALCKGQTIRADVTAIDDHGRTVAKCFLPDGRDLSAELVKQGLAIDWPKYSGGIYRQYEVPDARKRMWLADARQKGRMHVWDKYNASKTAKTAAKP